MDFSLDRIVEKLEKNDLAQNFIKELEKSLKKEEELNQEETKNSDLRLSEDIENIQLTPEEELQFDRKEFEFLQQYFTKELSDPSKDPLYIVTNKYENDNEYHRYKVTQYKNNFECKYIAFEKDLPENVRLGDAVRKVNGEYIYDEEATIYLKEVKKRIKEDIINNRDKTDN